MIVIIEYDTKNNIRIVDDEKNSIETTIVTCKVRALQLSSVELIRKKDII